MLLSWFFFFESQIVMYLCVNLFKSILLGVCLASLMFMFMSFIKVGIFSLYFFKYAFYPILSFLLWGLPQAYAGLLDYVLQVPQALFTFLPSFFLFLRLGYSYCPTSGLPILPSTCSNVLLNPQGEIFITVIILFNSRISFWFLFIIFISVLIFLAQCDICFTISFSYLLLISFSSLCIFRTLDLKILVQ